MEYIKVQDDNLTVNLPTKENKIQLQCLQAYFPNATTITYKLNDEIIGLEVNDHELKLVKNVTEYNVFYPNSKKINMSDPKQKRVNEILAIINKEKKSSESDMSPPKKVKNCAASSSKKCERLLFIGWKHKYSVDTKYVLMKEPVGGTKNITLNINTNYSIEDIKAKAVQAMKTNINSYIFKHTEINLGSFDENIFETFTDEQGANCSFWEFSPKIKSRNRQLKVYLLTKKLRETTVDSLLAEKFDSIDSIENTNNPSDLKPVNSQIDPPLQSAMKKSPLLENSNTLKSQSSKVNNNVLTLNLPFNKFLEGLNISVPIIDREDLFFTSKECGRGSQGSVTVANWLGTDVAVKTVRFSANNKYLSREIECMSKIRHPNIVSIMGVSVDPFNCFIVMELFSSRTLRSVIFSDHLSEENKNVIATQICTAVSFLHQLSPTIVHKDIKPENILMNSHYVVKLCDFGLSKFNDACKELCTTIGRNAVGTPLYMAPEILLLNESGSTKSDVWAVACVIKELYSGKTVWDVPQNIFSMIDTLKNKLSNQEKPDLRSIPKLLTRLITACFEYKAEKRPKCSTLLDMLKCLNDDE